MADEQPKLTSFELNSMQLELVHLMEQAGEEDGPEQLKLLDEEILKLYELLGDAPEEKISALRAVAIQTEAQVGSISKEIKALQAAKRARTSTIDRLMNGLAETKGVTKLTWEGHTYWIARTWQMHAPAETAHWPDRWTKEVTTVEQDRSAAREALRGGAPVPDGWAWTQVDGVRWR